MQVLRHLNTNKHDHIHIVLCFVQETLFFLTPGESHLHLSPASAAVPLLHTDDWSPSRISLQTTLCKPKKNLKIKNKPTFSPSNKSWSQTWGQLPVDLTACPANFWVNCGLSSLHCAQVRSAPECHLLCASELHHHSQYGFERVPTLCP